MRFNIASKIAVSIIGMVILSVGMMAWIGSQNLRAGFITYLNEQEADNLAELSKLFAAEYSRDGSFERYVVLRSQILTARFRSTTVHQMLWLI